jgi:hypothetical protein
MLYPKTPLLRSALSDIMYSVYGLLLDLNDSSKLLLYGLMCFMLYIFLVRISMPIYKRRNIIYTYLEAGPGWIKKPKRPHSIFYLRRLCLYLTDI